MKYPCFYCDKVCSGSLQDRENSAENRNLTIYNVYIIIYHNKYIMYPGHYIKMTWKDNIRII